MQWQALVCIVMHFHLFLCIVMYFPALICVAMQHHIKHIKLLSHLTCLEKPSFFFVKLSWTNFTQLRPSLLTYQRDYGIQTTKLGDSLTETLVLRSADSSNCFLPLRNNLQFYHLLCDLWWPGPEAYKLTTCNSSAATTSSQQILANWYFLKHLHDLHFLLPFLQYFNTGCELIVLTKEWFQISWKSGLALSWYFVKRCFNATKTPFKNYKN